MEAATGTPSSARQGGPDPKTDRIRDQVLALDVKRVADWLHALVRTIKAHRMYLPNNPTLHRFQSDLETRTWSCLKEIGDIPLIVQQFDLLFENYSVYHNAAREESLAFRLHSDGIREITIREGLEPHELRGFVDVLRRATDGPSVQDDVVTLLWERDLRHIEYVFIPLEDLTQQGTPGDADEAAPSEEASIPWPQGADEPAEEAAAIAGEASPSARSDDWVPGTAAPSTLTDLAGIQFLLDEEERARLAKAIEREEKRPLRAEVLEIVSAILSAEETPASFLDSAIAFRRFIELAVEEGNVAHANGLVERLRSIAAKRAESEPEIRDVAEEVIREIGRPSFLGQIAPVLNAHAAIDPETLTKFLVQLTSYSTPAICDLLGQVNQMKHRRALCEALAIVCRDDVEPLLERLNDSRWYVIRNLVYVLGRIAHQGVERALDKALHHEDIRVRKEAVRALGNLESPTSRAYLIAAFRDSDASVRVQAAMTLAAKRDDRAAQSLLAVIQAPEFRRRDAAERRAFFEALGRSGSDALAPRLESMLVGGGLFRSSNEEERANAALALAWLGTPAALGILNREIESKREPVRKAVEVALASVRHAGGSSPDGGPTAEGIAS